MTKRWLRRRSAGLAAFVLFALVTVQPGLFRRGRNRPTRSAAFDDVFDAVATIFEAAARVKPEWGQAWQGRRSDPLPPRYAPVEGRARDAAHELRFARALLQRNRWRSIVEPMFTAADEDAWLGFAQSVAPMATNLLAIRDVHASRLRDDEVDWIDDAIEQFSDAWRQVLRADASGAPIERRIAEGMYLHLYLALQLGDRFLDRVCMEATEGGR